MNRRSFLRGCAMGAPLIAIPAVVMAQRGAVSNTGEQASEATGWPLTILEVRGEDGRMYRIPSWGLRHG